jgi:hypothetical protein
MFCLQLGVTILGRRFSDTIQSVPIKKRMRLQTDSSTPLLLDCSQVSTADGLSHDNHIDFSGISILADAACKSSLPDEDTDNFPLSEVQPPKGENRVVMPREASEVKSPKYDCIIVPLESSSTHLETTEVLNNESDKSFNAENVSRHSRLHWDLNIVMDVWECDQQEGGDCADYEQKNAAMVSNTEVCNDHKEEPDKDRNEEQEVTCRNGGNVPEIAAPKSDLHVTELRKEGDIFSEVNPKDPVLESIAPPRDCSVLIIPQLGPSLTKEEVKNENEPYSNQLSVSEHEQLSMSKPAEIKEEIELSGSITEKLLEVSPQLEPTTEPELILEECTKESVTSAPGSEPKDARMGDDQTGTDAMMGRDIMEHGAMTGGDIVEHDLLAVDDKLEHGGLQSDREQLAEEKKHADLRPIETGMMPMIDNDNGHTTDEKAAQQVNSTAGSKYSFELDKHGSSVEFQNDGGHSNFYPPKKDLEEDDYQYEDGELREPAMHYWGTVGFESAETENGPHETDERCDNQAVNVDAQEEEKLLEVDAGVQPDNCMDANMILKMDMESKDRNELLQNCQANSLNENECAEVLHSSKVKTTGWDKQPESSRKSFESPLEQEIMPGSPSFRRDLSLCINTPRSTDDPYRNDKSFVRSRRYVLLNFTFYSCFVLYNMRFCCVNHGLWYLFRSREGELDGRVEQNPRASRMHERGMPSRHHDTNRRDEHWVETRSNIGRPHHRTTEFGAPSYAPSNSGNATAASVAKVKSNGFVVAPDGTLVKAGGLCSTRKCQNSSSFYQESPIERDHRGLSSSRERIVSPDRFGGMRGGRAGRCAVEPARERYHRPVIEISASRRRQRSFSPRRGSIHQISPSHIRSPSRSRTRSPNAWVSPPARGRCLADHEPRHERGRSPIHRMGPDYDDRIGAPKLVHSNHHHFPPHGMRCVNERRCTSPGNLMRRSPPQTARFYPLDSPPPLLHRQRDEFYHQPRHSGRCNGFDHRRGFEDDQYELVRPERLFERSANGDGFRPRNSCDKSFESHRSSPRGFNRGLVGDVNRRGKEDRDSFKFGKHNNGKYEKHDMRNRSGGGDDEAMRRRLS